MSWPCRSPRRSCSSASVWGWRVYARSGVRDELPFELHRVPDLHRRRKKISSDRDELNCYPSHATLGCEIRKPSTCSPKGLFWKTPSGRLDGYGTFFRRRTDLVGVTSSPCTSTCGSTARVLVNTSS